jgi:type I restriction enzyme S subunit
LRIGNLTRDSIRLNLEDIQRVTPPAGVEGDRTEVNEGDVLFSITAYLGSAAVVPGGLGRAYVSQHVCLARLANGNLMPDWLAYSVLSASGKAYLEAESYGGTKVQLALDDVKSFPLSLPPIEEQRSLITFLDHETAKIDALIAEQQRLIELLQEKRQAVISHAVTKGLNPDAPMKDSGVEWLGEVPEHWRVSPLKHLATIQTGIAKGKDLEDMETIDVPYLRVANVQDGYLILDEVHLLAVPVASIDRYLLNEGDVLMNEGGDFDKLGRGCIWSGEIAPCVHQNHVFAVRPYSVSGEWLNAYTTSKAANSYFISRSKQSTNLASISSTNLMGLPVPLPPAEEARETLGRLNQLINEIDDLKHSAIQAIALLQERRSALISAAVTGQIDVRGLVTEACAA